MPLHNLLSRFHALKHDPRTGGELTVTTRPAPSRAVRQPDPQRDPQKVITALCETVHALQTRLVALEQGKFGMSGQPATLTVTGRPGHSHAPAPTRPQARNQSNVRPCPIVQAYGNDYSASANHSDHDRSVPPGSSVCPLVATGDW